MPDDQEKDDQDERLSVPPAIVAAAELSDRDFPYTFVGRRKEWEKFEQHIRRGMRGAKGSTFTFHGPPGIGKTAIMSEFMRRCQGLAEPDPAKPIHPAKAGREEAAPANDGALPAKTKRLVCLKVATRALEQSPRKLMHSITKAMFAQEQASLHPSPRNEYMKKQLRALLQKGATWMAIFRAREKDAFNVVDTLNSLTDDSPMDECVAAYATEVWAPHVAIALFVDEMQNCDKTKNAMDILETVHLGELEAPMMSVLFGLPGLLAKLDQMGLSRPADEAVSRVGTLPEGDWRLTVDRQFQALGMLPGPPAGHAHRRAAWLDFAAACGFSEQAADQWVRDAAQGVSQRAQGFPQHIAIGLKNVCRALVDGKDAFSPDNPLHDIAANKHDKAKERYYNALLSPPMEHKTTFDDPSSALPMLADYVVGLGAICRICATHPDGARRAQAVEILAKFGTESEAKVALGLACAKGILTVGKQGDNEEGADYQWVGQPVIPSLSAHLQDWYADSLVRKETKAIAIRDEFNIHPCKPASGNHPDDRK